MYCGECGSKVEKRKVVEIIEEKEIELESKTSNIITLSIVLVTIVISIGLILLFNNI